LFPFVYTRPARVRAIKSIQSNVAWLKQKSPTGKPAGQRSVQEV